MAAPSENPQPTAEPPTSMASGTPAEKEATPAPDQAASAAPAEDETPGFWDSVTWERSSSVGLLITEGVDGAREGFRPQRELRLTDRSKFKRESYSFQWHLRWQGNRDAMLHGKDLDEDYATQRTSLPNGSFIAPDQQLIVREAYLQKLEDSWMLQLGSQAYAWGPSDGINPLSVMSPQDLRLGISGEKETKVLAVPSARLAFFGDDQTINLVYAPWQRASLVPQPGQNWNLQAENLQFKTAVVPEDEVEREGSFALKYDLNIPNGDLSLLYYRGADYDLVVEPRALRVENNQPLVLETAQVVPKKTSFGTGYSQTFGAWVLKGEGLYTPDKQAIPEINRADIQKQELPVETTPTKHLQTSVGFNYFTPIKSLFGLQLGETVLTAEYYRQRYLQKGIMPPFLSDILIGNLRTATLEDRLEVQLSYIKDLAIDGDVVMGKATFLGEVLHHGLTYAAFGGQEPDDEDDVASPFYYFRRNDYVSYEVSYSF